MTIASTVTSVQYLRNGTTTQWGWPNKIFSAADLTVSDLDTSTPPLATLLILGVDYTVSNVDVDTGCLVTTTIAGIAGHSIDIRSNIAQLQSTSIKNQGSYLPELHEEAFDRLTRETQDLTRKTYTYGIHGPDNEVAPWPALPAAATRRNNALMFDALTGLPALGVPNTQTITTGLLAPFIHYDRTAAEIAVGVTPTDYGYAPGDIRRFALLNGTDETVAVQNWAKVGGNLTFPVPQTVFITAAIPFFSNTTVNAVEGATVQTATHDINMFVATLQSSIVIRGLHFKQTSVGAASGVAGVLLDRCTDCLVEKNEFEGMQFTGIWAPGAQYSTFRGNYFHDAGASGNSTADINLGSTTTPSLYNVIEGNKCFGAAEFGISVWDPDSGVIPAGNIIANNRIGGGQTGYGILIYMPNAADTYNQVIGNHIRDVRGAVSPNPNSGAGIYVVGAGAGGTQVIGNTIINCCRETSGATLAPAGIGISGTSSNSSPVLVSGNTIQNMTQYHGILLTGCNGGVTVTGNTVLMPAANVTGDAIRITNCANWAVTANMVTQLNTTTSQRGIVVFASGANCTFGAITGNTIKGGHISCIETAQSGGFLVSGLTISGNNCSSTDNACIPLLLGNASAGDVLVTGNYFSGGNAAVVSQVNCINVRYANNRLKGTGATVANFTGTNTTSYYDKTNIGAADGTINNAGTGLITELFDSAVPATGTHAVGDRREQSVPVVGNPKGWRCTVAGTSGTWVSEGNL